MQSPRLARLERFFRVGSRRSCPPDQMANFLAAGYVPQPKQMFFHAAARECDLPGGPDQVGFGGARGGGKSVATLAQLALDDCQRFPGVKCLYLRKIATKASEQFDDLRRKVLAHVPHDYKATKSMVLFPNGSRIITGHFKDEKDVDGYLGMEYDIIVIEEATTLTASKYQALRDSNRSSRANFRPRIYATTNPGGVGHFWFRQRFVDPSRLGEEEYTRFIPATLDDNKFLDEGYRRRVEENTGWKLRAYRYGDWDIAAGQFFTTWRFDVHVIRPFAIPPDWPMWAGFDYGWSHPTAVEFGTVDGDGTIYVIGEHVRAKTTVPQQCRLLKDWLKKQGIPFERIWPWAAGTDVFARRGDSSGKTIAEQYADEDIFLARADVDRINGWAEILRRLGDPEAEPVVPPSLYIFGTCKRLIETIPVMQHDPLRSEDVLKWDIDEEGRGGDDSIDSLRYLLMARNVGATGSFEIPGVQTLEQYDTGEWGAPIEVDARTPDYVLTSERYAAVRRGINRV